MKIKLFTLLLVGALLTISASVPYEASAAPDINQTELASEDYVPTAPGVVQAVNLSPLVMYQREPVQVLESYDTGPPAMGYVLVIKSTATLPNHLKAEKPLIQTWPFRCGTVCIRCHT